MSGTRRTGRGSLGAAWPAGFLVGAALGAAITVLGRRAEAEARTGLVDWSAVERLAEGRLRHAAGRLTPAEVAATAPAYESAMRLVVPALEAVLETPLPGVVERVVVVDRAGWVRANMATFAGLFGRLEGELLDQIVPPGAGLGKASLALANRWIATRQFGLLLGFMGQRVLGQYDLALLSAEAEPGQLLFVEENVRQTAGALGVPVDPFRIWIALHETTHAFEFEAHPWLRSYLADRLERQLAGLSRSTSDLGRDASRLLGRALRGGDGHWLERLMSDEQRRLFRETQTVMSLLEGFSDHIMDEVGRDLVPGVESISARFHARRARRTPMERAILRITGLDLKMEQYARGERFVAAVQQAAGPAGLRRLWEGPGTLPRDGELEMPERWVRRVVGTPAGSGRAGVQA
ncbi:MAG TPA: zinc-dependent metalloprotease [Patescibacteria group bacterium]|nr:zinc-dependent metalloprotease [Patescibacteria group bacterium]